MAINLKLVCVILWMSFHNFEVTKAAGNSQRGGGLSSHRSGRDSQFSISKAHRASSLTTPPKLEQISVLFAHGVKPPSRLKSTLDTIQVDSRHITQIPAYWENARKYDDGFTEHGCIQMKKLGQALKAKYNGALRVQDVTLVAASSAKSASTRLSAKAVIEGFAGRNDITIDSVTNDNPDYTSLGTCPRLDSQVKMKKDEKLARLRFKFLPLLMDFNANVPPSGNFERGAKIHTALELWIVSDNIMREYASGLKDFHPEAICKKYADFAHFHSEFTEIWNANDVHIVNQLRIGQTMHRIMGNIIRFVRGSNPGPKVRLYSSFEVTVVSFLKLLEVNSSNNEIFRTFNSYPVWPGSALIFELYSRGNANEKEYFVQVVFNVDATSFNAVPLLLEGCGHTMCPLKTFFNKVNAFALTPEGFRRKCYSQN